MREPVKHRMTRRLNGWDYCQRAVYMVTVTLKDRSREWLGRLEERAENGAARDGGGGGSVVGHYCPESWVIEPTPFGRSVLEALDEMPVRFPQVRILGRQLMPEHFHFIVFARERLPKPLGALVRGFKAGAAKRWKKLAKNGEAQDGEGRAKNGEAWDGERPEWGEGFQDTILFREGQLEAMKEYIRENPARLAEKRMHPELFRRVARLEVPLDGGRICGSFEAIGNRHLLRRPLHQVQCSRRFFAWRREEKPGGGTKIARDAEGKPLVEQRSEEFEERLAEAMEHAAHGAVVLSPCISDGEREIAREALERGVPLVTLQNKGFSPLQKPLGRYFEACAAGRLLMMAPAAWPHTTQAKPMTREDATALNRLCQWLAGENAAAPDYHGMRPNNIDELARRAVFAKETEGDAP